MGNKSDRRLVGSGMRLRHRGGVRVAQCDQRRWLANVSAAATTDALLRRTDHAHLRAYLERWRWEAGEFFGRGASD
jgi:hypothetical protein